MKTTQGFTLIELIIVIVILGILTVTAAPRFFGLSSSAQKSLVEGMTPTLYSAVNIVYAQSVANGLDSYRFVHNNTATTKDGAQVTVNNKSGIQLVYGFPNVTGSGIAAAIEYDLKDWLLVATASSTDPMAEENNPDSFGTFYFYPKGYNESTIGAPSIPNPVGENAVVIEPSARNMLKKCYASYTVFYGDPSKRSKVNLQTSEC